MRMAGVLALCCLPAAAMAEGEDRGYLTALLEDNLSGAGRAVVITGFEGGLSSRATIERLTIADAAGVWITLDGVVLDWNRSALLRGVVEVAELSAERIALDRMPGTETPSVQPEAGQFALPDLPVSLRIGRLAADRIVLGDAVLGAPVEARLDASATLDGGEGALQLRLERVDGGPEGRLDLTASYANATGQLAVDLQAEEAAGGIVGRALDLPGGPSLRLAVQGTGPVAGFAAKVGLWTDGVERLAGTVQLRGDAGGAQGFAVALAGNPAPLWLPEQAAFLGDRVALTAEGDRSAEGVLRLRQFSVTARALDLQGRGTLAGDGMPLDLALRGRVGLADGTPVLLPMSGAAGLRLRSAELDLEFDGRQDSGWSARVEIDGLRGAGLTAERLAVQGSGRIWRRDGRAHLGGTVALTGAGVVPADAGLAAALGRDVAGQVVLDWRGGGDGLRLARLALEGADYGVTGRATVAGLDQALTVSGSAVAWMGDLARLSGIAGRPLGGVGEVSVEGQFGPLTGAFDGRMVLDGRDLRVSQPQVDALLRGVSRVTLSAARTVEGTALRDLTLSAGGVAVQASGTITSGQSAIAATGRIDDLSVLGGGWRGGIAGGLRVEGRPEALQIVVDGTGRDLGIGQAEADRLLRGETRLSAELGLIAGAVQVEGLRLANPQMEITVEGAADDLELAGRLANLGLLLPEFPGPVTLRGTAGLPGAGGQALDLRIAGPGGISARIAGRLQPGGTENDLTVTGTAQAGLVDPFLSGRLVSGPVRFDLGLRGPLAPASLSGRVSLSGGRIADPAVAFALQGVELVADLSGGRAQIGGSARLTSGGTATVAGTLGLTAPFVADLQVGLRDAVLRDPDLYETTAKGEVTLRGPLAGGARLSGQIGLGRTELRIPSTGFGGAADIPDLRHVAEPEAVRATRGRAGMAGGPADGAGAAGGAGVVALDLLISAPSRIQVRGRGLDAELGGALRLGGTTAAVVPSGSFTLIRGRLDILGKRLALREATLALEGGFVPMLSVAASNESEGITSFVRIDGPADAPTVRFTSDPDLPEEEVLSRLLFGRGIDTLSPLQAAQLANAVATLAGRGGLGIMTRLRQGFGLDDLDVETGAEGGTTVRAGKYLSDRLYTEVEVDDQGESTINLNLDLTDQITARARAGTTGETGLGLFLERDY